MNQKSKNKIIAVNFILFGILPAVGVIGFRVLFTWLFGTLRLDTDFILTSMGLVAVFLITGLVLGVKVAQRNNR
jgi:hypothetical protein